MDASQMWAEYCETTGTNPSAPHDVWKFCDGGPAADELADLVFLGRKTATSRSSSSCFRWASALGPVAPRKENAVWF